VLYLNVVDPAKWNKVWDLLFPPVVSSMQIEKKAFNRAITCKQSASLSLAMKSSATPIFISPLDSSDLPWTTSYMESNPFHVTSTKTPSPTPTTTTTTWLASPSPTPTLSHLTSYTEPMKFAGELTTRINPSAGPTKRLTHSLTILLCQWIFRACSLQPRHVHTLTIGCGPMPKSSTSISIDDTLFQQMPVQTMRPSIA